ncbi:hypothetical protein LZC95_37355 [Pendulispora brunnea]|uniref:Uncharacterized protein n=1 Tax=Pendulispora brunnea TaxID=2905690 RepID=A0ABZ2K426_9BACT
MKRTLFSFVGLLLAAVPLVGCASGPPASAYDNHTFYQYDDLPGGPKNTFETAYPSLDYRDATGEYIGVAILGGTVRFSRPRNWIIRRASLTPQKRFIEYVSPNQYVFAVYERLDPAGDSWGDVLARYEEDAKTAGAEVVAGRVPVASLTSQGREYVVKRNVKASKAPYTNFSREILMRGANRYSLVEIVHQGESVAPVVRELLRVVDTFQPT